MTLFTQWSSPVARLTLLIFLSTVGLSQSEEKAPGNVSDETWQAIQKMAETYVAAFKEKDAGKISELYTTDAELIDSSGNLFQGRKIIADEYAAFFASYPDATLSIDVESLKFPSKTMAIEDGTMTSFLGDDEPAQRSRYVAIHVLEEGKWRIASMRDEALPPEVGDNLKELEWMIGNWIDEGPDSMMEINCRLHENGAFLIRDFKIKVEGLLAASGTERIGWDPVARKFRSWLFDEKGGFLEGTWIPGENRWTIAASGFREDGAPIHATYVVTPLRKDAYHLESFDRTAGDEAMEDFEMTIVRRPPEPEEVPVIESENTKEP